MKKQLCERYKAEKEKYNALRTDKAKANALERYRKNLAESREDLNKSTGAPRRAIGKVENNPQFKICLYKWLIKFVERGAVEAAQPAAAAEP